MKLNLGEALNDADRDRELFTSIIAPFQCLNSSLSLDIQVNLSVLCTCHQNSKAISCDVQEIQVSEHVAHDFARDQKADVHQLIKQNEKSTFQDSTNKKKKEQKKDLSQQTKRESKTLPCL